MPQITEEECQTERLDIDVMDAYDFDMKANLIRQIREKNGVTMRWLSEQLGIHRATLANYETGKQEAPKSVLFMVASLLHVSVSDLE